VVVHRKSTRRLTALVHVTVAPLIELCGTTENVATCGPVAVETVLVAVTVAVAVWLLAVDALGVAEAVGLVTALVAAEVGALTTLPVAVAGEVAAAVPRTSRRAMSAIASRRTDPMTTRAMTRPLRERRGGAGGAVGKYAVTRTPRLRVVESYTGPVSVDRAKTARGPAPEGTGPRVTPEGLRRRASCLPSAAAWRPR
jgi:hypothetical protein